MEKPKGIYPKLHAIQQRINGLGKDKTGPNGHYKYVTGDKILGEIKPIMNELGLILKQEITSIENSRQDYKTKNGEKSEILSKVMMRFTWIDTESGEKDENLFGANGQNDWEKGLGSALTYGERYFLLKFFHIATDEDDIDNGDRKPIQEASPIKQVVKQKIEFTPQHAKWEATKQRISEGSYTIEELEKIFILSEENKKLLLQK